MSDKKSPVANGIGLKSVSSSGREGSISAVDMFGYVIQKLLGICQHSLW
jgi:hypothetical protein